MKPANLIQPAIYNIYAGGLVDVQYRTAHWSNDPSSLVFILFDLTSGQRSHGNLCDRKRRVQGPE